MVGSTLGSRGSRREPSEEILGVAGENTAGGEARGSAHPSTAAPGQASLSGFPRSSSETWGPF